MPSSDAKSGRTLSNLNFLTARPEKAGKDRLRELIECRGGTATNFPVIRLELATSPQEIETRLGKVSQFPSSIVFVSGTGVQFLFESCSSEMLSKIASSKLFAIGKATADALENATLGPSTVAPRPNSRSLAELLIANRQYEPFLICRGEQGSSELATILRQSNIKFNEWTIYRAVPVDAPDPQIKTQLQEGKFDWVLLTSSEIAKQTCRLFGADLHESRLASMSPAISTVVRNCGFTIAAEAQTSNFDGLVEAIELSNAN